MAQKVNIILVDDLDGSEAHETITFGLDGSQYEIDLNDKNATKLRKALTPFVGPARRVSKGRVAAKRPANGAAASDVRAWALSQGHTIPARGRIPAEIQKAYAER